MQSSHQLVSYQRFAANALETIESPVISEAAVSLTINGQAWLEFLCTPTYLEALAVGFLFNENLIASMKDLALVHSCEAGDNIDVWTTKPLTKPAVWRRTSGCGGGATSQLASSPARISDPPTDNIDYAQNQPIDFSVRPADLLRLMQELTGSQDLYHKARGVHSAALSDGESLFLQVEDIGRHNTLDKIAGRLLLEAPPLQSRILLATGRVSSEMLQKAQRIGVGVVVSRTSPTTLSVRMAQETGITLIGYARHDQFNVYTHHERISLES